MVLKLNALTDWVEWQVGRYLPLPKDKSRTVRISLIMAGPTMLRALTPEQYAATQSGVVDPDAVLELASQPGQLLAVFPFGGHEIVEFVANGDVLLSATSDEEIRFYCSENDQYWFEFDQPTFAKPFERQVVDPAFRHMQMVMLQNMQAMEARLQATVDRAARKRVEPPRAATVAEKEAEKKKEAEDAAKVAAAERSGATEGAESQAEGETSATGEQKPAPAKSAGKRVSAPASGKDK